LTLLVVTMVELMATLSASASPLAQGGEQAAGIRPLDAATNEEAIACGKSGPECAVTRYLLCPSGLRPYVARIATPFSRVAASVFEAEKSHRRVRPPGFGLANSWGLGVYVLPAPDADAADAIEKVFVRRGDQIIEPTTTTLAPMIVETLSGARSLSRGFFAFPMHTFAPTSDLVVVFVGQSGESSCPLDQHTLSALR
jgi:hypothetical protein